MNIKVDEEMVAKVMNEYEYFNQLIDSGIHHYEKARHPLDRVEILSHIRRDRAEKNEFLRALAIIGFPGVSNVNGFYEFDDNKAYEKIGD